MDEPADEIPTTSDLWEALDGSVGNERAEVLLALHRVILDDDEDASQALSLADAAHQVAIDVGNETLQAMALMGRGRALYQLAQYDESAESHLAAGRLAARGTDPLLTARAFLLGGDSLSQTEHLADAREPLDASESAFLAGEDLFGAGRAALYLGRVLWRLDLNQDALEVLDRARSHLRRIGAAAEVLTVDDLRASALIDLERPGAAVDILRATVHVASTLGPEANLPYARFRLGAALRLAGQPADALGELRAASEGYLELGDLRQVGRCLFEEAVARWDLDETDDAFLLLSRARAHFDVTGWDTELRQSDVRRAIWQHGVGDFEGAARTNRSLLDATDPATVYWARTRLADNHRTLAQPERCLEVLAEGVEDRADAMVGEIGKLWRISLRARALLALGRNQSALDEAEHGLGLADETSPPDLRAHLYDVRSQLREGDGATADRAHAIALYLAAGMTDRAKELSQSFLPEAHGRQLAFDISGRGN